MRVFPDVYDKYQAMLGKNKVLVVQGGLGWMTLQRGLPGDGAKYLRHQPGACTVCTATRRRC